MKTQFTTRRKASATLALALGLVVTFSAAIQSYGTVKNKSYVYYDISAALERAYADATKEDHQFIEVTPEIKTVRVFNSEDELVETFHLANDEDIDRREVQQKLGDATFLSEYANIVVYKRQ